MSLVEIVQQASLLPLTTEDGKPAWLELAPPVSEEELLLLESEIPCALPDEVRELLRFSSGFGGGAIDLVDFTGERCSFEFESAFPHGLPIAADGMGNFWVVDLTRSSLTWGPIYFACHDPPVILYQSATIAEFLEDLFRLSEPPYESPVADVQRDHLDVWRTNPGVREHAECLTSGDPELRSFADRLGPTFQFIDLRDASVGFGFSWGRYGTDTVVRRHGDLPIFAYEKKKWFLSRIFGGSG